MICKICNKSYKGMKGEQKALLVLLGIVPLTLLFGFEVTTVIVFPVLALYIFKTQHSGKYICPDCLKRECLQCHKVLPKGKCDACKLVVCPHCGSHQPFQQWFLSLPLATLAIVVLLITIFFKILAFVDFGLVLAVVFGYLLLTAPVCKSWVEKFKAWRAAY